MPKVLITADLHLTANRHESYRHDLVGRLPSLLKSERAEALLILGDLTEEKDRHPAKLVNMIVDHLARCSARVPVLLLMGNHDYANEGHPFFAFTNKLPNVVWIDKVTDGADLPGPYLPAIFKHHVFLPHTRNHERDWQDVKWDNFDIAFAHNTFTGATTSTGKLMEGIKLTTIPKHVDVIAGDIHVPQVFNGLEYVGAPYRVDFGDEYKAHLMMLDTKSGQRTVLDTSHYPQKVTVDFSSDDPDSYWPQLAGIVKGDVVRARIEVPDLSKWHDTHAQIRHAITQLGAIPYKILPVIAKGEQKRRHDVKQRDTGIIGEREVMTAYQKRHDINERLMAEGLDIIEHGADALRGLTK